MNATDPGKRTVPAKDLLSLAVEAIRSSATDKRLSKADRAEARRILERLNLRTPEEV